MAAAAPDNANAAAANPAGQVINLGLLDLQQLQALKTQVETELNFYQDAIIQLKEVQVKMNESMGALKRISPARGDLLVPVTGSMFVRGTLAEKERVLVDIGTGYYVDKSMADAIDYFKRKVDFLGQQIEKVQQVGRDKSSIRSAITEVMETKVMAMQRQQQQVLAQAQAAKSGVK